VTSEPISKLTNLGMVPCTSDPSTLKAKKKGDREFKVIPEYIKTKD
jgi:hypothetical protein